jgi:hypothetical protein
VRQHIEAVDKRLVDYLRRIDKRNIEDGGTGGDSFVQITTEKIKEIYKLQLYNWVHGLPLET